MTEKYPVLAVSDAKVKWEYFNSKLSLALKNMRCQVKRKFHPSGHSKKVRYEKAVVMAQLKKTENEAYNTKVELMKAKYQKANPDLEHIKLEIIQHETSVNHRQWMDSKPSTKLSQKILDDYPFFHHPECIFAELWVSH